MSSVVELWPSEQSDSVTFSHSTRTEAEGHAGDVFRFLFIYLQQLISCSEAQLVSALLWPSALTEQL